MDFPSMLSARGDADPLRSILSRIVAKTQNPSVPDAKFESFSIPSLDFVDNYPDKKLLCPVRVLLCYLKGT